MLTGIPSTDRIRVAIIDDHPAVRESLSVAISSKIGFEVCGMAGSAEEALHIISASRPDVAVVDLSLEDVNGLELVQTIRQSYPSVKTVVFSMYDEQVYAERAIRAGASGYLMKSEPTSQVIDAIRSAHAGEVFLSRAMAVSILGKGLNRRSNTPGFAVDELTEREMLVFRLLGEGQTITEIADHLNVEVKTAETYRRRAKEKLGLQTVNDLLQYAVNWQHGSVVSA